MSAKIDKSLVEHVAKLAHLHLSPDEVAYYEIQLTKVLGHISKLDRLKSMDLHEELSAETTLERVDTIVNADVIEAAMVQAPQRIGTAFQVPRMIE